MNEQNRLCIYYGKVKVLNFNIIWWIGIGKISICHLKDIGRMKGYSKSVGVQHL